jgi:hypothetical protein
MPHDLTAEQLDELAALVTLFDIELSEELELMLWKRANESRAAGPFATRAEATVTADELGDLAERLRSARGMDTRRTRPSQRLGRTNRSA